MEKKRIEYIDLLKGFSIILVVWFHTAHPAVIDYSFRMPLFFLASSIFFKTEIPFGIFIEKKISQLVIPFFFFYTLYYLFLILQWRFANESWDSINFSVYNQFLSLHKGNEPLLVNPPLWFIMALLNLQILQYVGKKVVKSSLILFLLSILISLFGIFYAWDKDTYFMLGRSLQYYVFYCFGNLYGKNILEIIEKGGKKSILLFVSVTLSFILCIIFKFVCVYNKDIFVLVDYFEIFSLILLLIYLFKSLVGIRLLTPLYFFGKNSYIVLGTHDMLLTVLLVAFTHFIGGDLNLWQGVLHLIVTLTIIYPIILLLNKYFPYLVGKKNVFDLCSKKKVSK